MALTIKIPARTPTPVPQKRKLDEDSSSVPSKRTCLSVPAETYSLSGTSTAVALDPPPSNPDVPAPVPTPPRERANPQAGPKLEAFKFLDIPNPGDTRPTFKEFVESLTPEQGFRPFPIEGSRLTFVRDPLRLARTQTLSVEADKGWVSEEKDKAKEVELKDRGAGDGEGVGKLALGLIPSGSQATEAELPGSRGSGRMCESDVVTVTRRVTRSMAKKMELEEKQKTLVDIAKDPGERVSIEKVDRIDSNTKTQVTRFTGSKERVQQGATSTPARLKRPRAHPTVSKCSTTVGSLTPSLRWLLPFTTDAELVEFLHNRPAPEILKFIESVCERHVWAFALRHSDRLRRDLKVKHPDCPPPPPRCVGEVNTLRLRYEHATTFLHRVRTSKNPVYKDDYEFILMELLRLEEEISEHAAEWHQHLAKYVEEYDELVVWLRLQAPIDTSGAKTLGEVKAILSESVTRIRDQRDDDIRSAIDKFVEWADLQYNAMKEQEGGRRRRALRGWTTMRARGGGS